MSAMTMNTEFAAAAPVQSQAAAAAPFFAVKDIHAYYGESYIVQGVSLDIRHGEILALLGRNGAGKSSTLRTIARLDNPSLKSGEIWLEGKAVHQMRAHEAARAGIQLVPEDRRIIQGLTVEENLTLAQVAPGRGWDLDRIYSHFPRLAERRKQEGVTLSGGEQQMLAIARILRTGAKFLLLDEPTEGLAPVIIEQIGRTIARLKREGFTIILVEQNFRFAQTVADRHYLVEQGRVVDMIPNADLERNIDKLHAHLGV